MNRKISNVFKVKIKMKDDIKLSLAEETVYAIISCNSDKDGVSHIRREVIAEKAGIKEVDTVTKHTNKLEEIGLLTKEYVTKQGKKRAIYHLRDHKDQFMFVSNDLFGCGLSNGEIGFAIKFARLR
jgi:DNA-binding MarR family transcriptional regulator